MQEKLLTRVSVTVASAAAMLGTATVVAMAPVSQAQAVGLHSTACLDTSKLTNCQYRAEGGARGNVENAKADAQKIAKCPSGWTKGSNTSWGAMGRWKNWDWYYADLYFSCARKR